MPAKSEQQRKWAFAVKGPEWAKKHHFDNPGKLPAHVQKGSANVGLDLFRQRIGKHKSQI